MPQISATKCLADRALIDSAQAPGIARPSASLPSCAKARQPHRGFTLLEMMVVMVIVGLLAVSVSLSLRNSSQQQLETNARRLKGQIALAMEQAIYRNRDYGAWMGNHDYRFFQREGEAWLELTDDPRLMPPPLDDGTTLSLSVWGQPVRPDAARREPQIFFFSDGQVSGFELALDSSGATRRQLITASFVGDLRLLEPTLP